LQIRHAKAEDMEQIKEMIESINNKEENELVINEAFEKKSRNDLFVAHI